MKNTFVSTLIAVLLLAIVSCGGQSSSDMSNITLNDKHDKASYALGMNIGSSFLQDGMTELNPQVIARAISDVIGEKDLLISKNEADTLLRDYFTEMKNAKMEKDIQVGKDFLAENGKRDGITTTDSGLQYEIMKEGNGPKPTATDEVVTHYHGTLINGKIFDSSVERGEPATFPVNRVIPGWTEALQLMPVGSKWKLFVPSELAYGARGAGQDIGPHSTLIFEVELLEIK